MDPRRILNAVTSLDSQAKSSASQLRGLAFGKITNRSLGATNIGDNRAMVMGSVMSIMDDVCKGIANPANTVDFESEIISAVAEAQVKANPYSEIEIGEFSKTLRKEFVAKVMRARSTIQL